MSQSIPYILTHAHTDYSNIRLLDSINKVSTLMNYCADLGLGGVAITDHESLGGHIRAEQHLPIIRRKGEEEGNANKANFKLILGNEIYLTRNGLTKANYVKDEDRYFHFILLAKDEIGHQQLKQLSSMAWQRSYYQFIERVPTYYEDLEKTINQNPGHLIGTTACIGGYLGFNLLQYHKTGNDVIWTKILNFLKWNKTLFPGDFYLEMQPSVQQEQMIINKYILSLSQELDIPYIITTDAHYLKATDRAVHTAYLNSKDGERETHGFYDSTYVMDAFTVVSYMTPTLTVEEVETGLINTLTIGKKIEDYSLKKKQVTPKIILPEIDSNVIDIHKFDNYEYFAKFSQSTDHNDRYLIYKIINGMNKFIPTHEYDVTLDRLNIELAQVYEASERLEDKLSAYLITMSKLIDLMWHEGDSLVGVSRGSAAGFMINYLLEITQINPLKQGVEMPYWRFLSGQRPDLMDIDVDTQGSKRLRIFNAIKNYFNSFGGTVVNVCTFGTETSKAAIQTACRGLGIDIDVAIYLSSLVPIDRGFVRTLKQCYYGDEEKGFTAIGEFKKEMDENPELWVVAQGIEGLINKRGIHAAGILIFNDDITEYNAIMKAPNGTLISQYELHDSEYMGGLKFDLLTIEALDKIRVCMDLLLEFGYLEWYGDLKTTYDNYLHPAVLDYHNSEMWTMVAQNRIIDLFQFDTPVFNLAA